MKSLPYCFWDLFKLIYQIYSKLLSVFDVTNVKLDWVIMYQDPQTSSNCSQSIGSMRASKKTGAAHRKAMCLVLWNFTRFLHRTLYVWMSGEREGKLTHKHTVNNFCKWKKLSMYMYVPSMKYSSQMRWANLMYNFQNPIWNFGQLVHREKTGQLASYSNSTHYGR